MSADSITIGWNDIDGFQMIVLDYLIMSNEPSRDNLQKIYRQGIKLGLVKWVEETAHITDKILLD